MTQTEAAESPLDIVRSELRDLAQHRGRPCLAIIGEIDRSAVQAALGAIGGLDGPAIDMIVSGPGGDIEAAYLMARTLRRRFRIDAAYVPWLAKSAATILCLAAEEIVLAELGELGPLDAQSPVGSALAPFKLLEQVSDAFAQGLRRNRGALQAGSARHQANQEAAEIAGAIVRSAISPGPAEHQRTCTIRRRPCSWPLTDCSSAARGEPIVGHATLRMPLSFATSPRRSSRHARSSAISDALDVAEPQIRSYSACSRRPLSRSSQM